MVVAPELVEAVVVEHPLLEQTQTQAEHLMVVLGVLEQHHLLLALRSLIQVAVVVVRTLVLAVLAVLAVVVLVVQQQVHRELQTQVVVVAVVHLMAQRKDPELQVALVS
jgi:hypothetical protein